MIGKTLSHYKVIEKIGQGGMGEVYRAEDTNLSREVAIKVLPEQFTKDPQRLARFEREAKLLASLNHPNIAAIHSFEHSDDIHFLVLELVPGETLAERVAKGPVPVEEALEICRQIAEGVEAAHEKGVIHRDLKPANVKVTPEGKVKILDFGLAKAFEEEVSPADSSQSPTLTEEMTRAGGILGTAAYMSPEQARGKKVDKRTDVWSFGCVLYECLTGKRAFEGETFSDTLVRVLEREPEWRTVPETTPLGIQNLLHRCLRKNSHERLHDIADARIEIEDPLSQPMTTTSIGDGRTSKPQVRNWQLLVSLVVLAGVLIGVGIGSLIWSSQSVSQPQRKFVVAPLSIAPLTNGRGTDLTISPGGGIVVYHAAHDGTTQLYLRSLDDLEVRPIPGTEGARGAFFSPDSESIAFFASGRLNRVSINGGLPLPRCEVSPTSDFVEGGGSWSPSGTIIFSAGSETGPGLFRVSAEGGNPESVAAPDPGKGEIQYRQPQVLPGDQVVLFTILGDGGFRTAVLSLETGEQKVVLEGGRSARFASTGHLVYESTRTGVLMAVPFDLEGLEVTGKPGVVLEGVRHHDWPDATVDYTFSAEGTLAYVPSEEAVGRKLVWVDRDGVEILVTESTNTYAAPRISPDGKQISVTIFESEEGNNVWIYDLEKESFRRLTFEGSNGAQTWSPDSKWLAFQSNRDGPRNLYRQLADGSAPAQRLTSGQFVQIPTSWSSDGNEVAFWERDDIWIVSANGDMKSQPFVTSPNYEHSATFSPDGQWLAYVSDETGQLQIYVRPYPEPDIKYLISGIEGGAEPAWSRNGRKLFYRGGDKMMSVSVQTKPTFSAGKPEVLFEGSYLSSSLSPGFLYWDVTPDGQRFLMIKEDRKEPGRINVVLNWAEELKRLVPTP